MNTKPAIDHTHTTTTVSNNLSRLIQLIDQLKNTNNPISLQLQSYALRLSTTLTQACTTKKIKEKKKLYQIGLDQVATTKQYLYKHYADQQISPKYCMLIQKDLSLLEKELEKLLTVLSSHPLVLSP